MEAAGGFALRFMDSSYLVVLCAPMAKMAQASTR